MLTPQLIDDRIKTCRDYEKQNLGIKIGPDFSDIARILMESKEFDSTAMLCALMGSMALIGRDKKDDATAEGRDKFLKEVSSGPKESLAMMFYIGYRLGQAESERAELERLAGK